MVVAKVVGVRKIKNLGASGGDGRHRLPLVFPVGLEREESLRFV